MEAMCFYREVILMWILEHRKSTVRKGVNELIWLALALIGFDIFEYFFFPPFWELGDFISFFIVFNLILAILAALMCIFAFQNIFWGCVFVCRISEDVLECFGAAPGSGDAFSIAITDIVIIEKKDSHWWYVIDKSGHRHWLTTNYDNPVQRFVEVIKRLNADVTEIAS
jgi:hypothetical protein